MTPNQCEALLPASYRTGPENFDLAAPRQDDLLTPLKQDLDLRRLVNLRLWVAGRPIPPRPMHHQRLLGREIVITEQMDLHLVWTSGYIYIKPLPRFLLEPRIWKKALSCLEGCRSQATGLPCDRLALRKCALGFLFSYSALIRHESDFSLAMQNDLLPSELDWAKWRRFVRELLDHLNYDQIDERFIYGELRLSRLNKLQYLRTGNAYISPWNRYGDFFHDNLAWLASATVYIAVVLTAMQVGLATSLATNEAFQVASYGFTVFSILGPLVVMLLLIAAFVCLFVWNWVATVALGKRRRASINDPEDAPTSPHHSQSSVPPL